MTATLTLHPVLGTPLPALTGPVPLELRDWRWESNARLRIRLVGLVLAAKGRTCHLCGLTGATTADHVIPWAHGGRNVVENLEPAHGNCNAVRQATPLAVWFVEHPVRQPTLRPSREW